MPDITPIILVTILVLIIATGIIMLVLVYQKKQLQYLKEKEQLKLSFENEILESKLEIQEQTMKNISQEIHDNIGQVLSVVKLNFNSMDCNDPVSLQKKISASSKLVSKAIQDLRELAKSLHADSIIEMGLTKSIEYELDTIKRAGNYQICLNCDSEIYHISQQQELILFRIFQEVISNIIKHSKAKTITVNMFTNVLSFQLEIIDDGDGFDLAAIKESKKKGLGIRNIENRAHIIGAESKIESEVGKGTKVKIILPVPI